MDSTKATNTIGLSKFKNGIGNASTEIPAIKINNSPVKKSNEYLAKYLVILPRIDTSRTKWCIKHAAEKNKTENSHKVPFNRISNVFLESITPKKPNLKNTNPIVNKPKNIKLKTFFKPTALNSFTASLKLGSVHSHQVLIF